MLQSHPCELCDHVSKNRYTSLIHNVRHIIIPLINQTVHQCEICLHHFTSPNDLSQHKSEKHPLNVVTISNNIKDELYECDLVTFENQENTSQGKADCYNDDNDKTSRFKRFSIKNRLLFEEDILSSNSDKLLADLTTDCKVKVEWIPSIWETSYPNSVHYNELINPGVFRCKKCSKTFPSRYAAITHEASHIFFKNSQVTQCELCKQYILGDINKLKQHHITSHAQEMSKKYFGGRSEENDGRCEENGGIDEPNVKLACVLAAQS
ncbi:unnamed protein product [Arctia plantaginis]|uniref:C2H2-type domain-containing protein n=1 Tax=Arctia plantaginis TaxID=874455 RepID=A0A8S0ZKN1_ARCPL|nr:unnamed protein product [Arctia plantaginis]